MKEDLLRLKKELELSREELKLKDKKYGLLDIYPSSYRFNGKFGSKTVLEIKQLEDTDGFIKKFEDSVKDIIRCLTLNGMPFDVIRFAAPHSAFFCVRETADEVFKTDKYCMDEDCDRQEILMSLNPHLKYVPVEFCFSRYDTGYYEKNGEFFDFSYDSLSQTNPNFRDKFSELTIEPIFAVVDMDKFIKKMREAGYGVELRGIGSCESADDYISHFKAAKGEVELVLSVNFNLEKTDYAKLRRSPF